MTDIFALATRKRLRFQVPQGEVNIESLWRVNVPVLISYEEELEKAVEQFGKTSRRRSQTKTAEQEDTELRLAIVSYILDVKEAEAKAATDAKQIKEYNEQIDRVIAAKKVEQMSNLSIEELEKLRK